jgi:hypothetical protein
MCASSGARVDYMTIVLKFHSAPMFSSYGTEELSVFFSLAHPMPCLVLVYFYELIWIIHV